MSFSLFVDAGDVVIPTLKKILLILEQQDQKMADFASDLNDLKDVVSGIVADLATVLDRLKNGNVTPDQLTLFEQQIAALKDVRSQLDAVNVPVPPPAPAPTPTPEPTPNPDQPTPPANP
jgi:hypothetical protein